MGRIAKIWRGCLRTKKSVRFRKRPLHRRSVCLGGVTRAAYRLEAWEALVDRRKRGELGVGFGLIPIGYGVEIVGAVVGVAVLDGGAQRFREGDRGIEMEAIDGAAAAGALFALYGRTEQTVRERML